MTATATPAPAQPMALIREKVMARDQLAADIHALGSGTALTARPVPPKPKPVSEHRGFFTVVAMILTFVGITGLGWACVAWWWPKEHLGESPGGVLLRLVIELLLYLGSPIVGLLAAVAVGGFRVVRAERARADHQVADFRYRFADERDWILRKVATGAMEPRDAIAIFQGEDAPLDAAQSLTKGSALTEAARFIPPPPPRPVSRTRKVFRFLKNGLFVLFIGAMVVADIATSEGGGSHDSGPSQPPSRPATDRTLQHARDVLHADIQALEAGRQITELPAPAEPAETESGRIGAWGWRRTVGIVLVLWAVLTVLLRWYNQDNSDYEPAGSLALVAGLLGWAMILLLSLCGALILYVVGLVAVSIMDGFRGSGAGDSNASDRLRYDFWRERETLRADLATGSRTPAQVLAMLHGVADAPPTITRVIQQDSDG